MLINLFHNLLKKIIITVMKTILLASIFFTISLFAQSNLPGNLVGTHTTYDFQRGTHITTNPVLFDKNYIPEKPNSGNSDHPDSAGSIVRYPYFDPASIGTYCMESGNGLKSIIGGT